MEKIIHYCWFGPKKMSKLENKCIESWKKYLPDYKIIKWSEENVDLEECDFIKEAYKQKKWAFVADYARSKALYEYGGIYFDTDMEVLRPLDEFTDKGLVLGLEDSKRPNAAIVICPEKHNKYMKQLTNMYKKMKFDPKSPGDLFEISIPVQLEKVLKPLGLKLGSKKIQVINKEVTIYPREYFYPYSYDMQDNIFTDKTATIHHFSGSWTSKPERIAIWLRRHKMDWLVKYLWSLNNIKKRIFKGKKHD